MAGHSDLGKWIPRAILRHRDASTHTSSGTTPPVNRGLGELLSVQNWPRTAGTEEGDGGEDSHRVIREPAGCLGLYIKARVSPLLDAGNNSFPSSTP